MIEIELPDFSEITVDGLRMLNEKQVKHNGIWRFHKKDPDDIFPSDPHGDRVDEPEKMNIYNGNIYSSTDKHFLYTMPKKAMKFIYNILINCKEEELKNKLEKNKSLIIYL
jgi:hypothetical protein